mgnify:CR=1 FL=1
MHRLFQNLWLHIFTRITQGCEILEAGKFFPNLKCGVLSASSDFADAQLWISSYTQLRRNRAAVEKIDFEIGVLDEAQFIKNPDAKTTAACMA